MRVVNVDDLKSRQEQRAKRQKASRATKRMVLVVVGVLFIGGIGYGLWFIQSDVPAANNVIQSQDSETSTDEILGLPDKSGAIKTLKGNEFRDLYRSINYPNVTQFATAPEITGNVEADDRIRELAVKRGFVLTGYPTTAISRSEATLVADTDDDLLQPLALAAWQKLEKEAQAAGMPLLLSSGYRSVERQRELFLERLLGTGISIEQIANGLGDEAVESTLFMTAPPGFSRHHTGYTIDLICGDELTAFKGSVCDEWLRQDDFSTPKQFGWIPSYPDDADSQGPEPEPWEYVWVGQRHLQD